MISQTAEYAPRAVTFLGRQQGRACTTAELATETAAPPSYLAKVMKGLSRAGMVHSQRGLHGGFVLARDPREISILDVVQAVDALRRIDRCPLGRPRHASGLCPLHRRMDSVLATAEATLQSISLGEVLEEPGLLCALPCIAEPSTRIKETST